MKCGCFGPLDFARRGINALDACSEASLTDVARRLEPGVAAMIPAEAVAGSGGASNPATGEIKRAKQPHFIRASDGRGICFAGLMSYWKNPETGEALRSCAILTASAAGPLAEIHDRAPVVLPQDVHAAWLDRKLTDAHRVKAIADARMPPEQFTHYKVRLLVNNTRAQRPGTDRAPRHLAPNLPPPPP